MSGDVQPRKRKDKKKKKDELGLEEPRGTAATLGEGDVFMHSYSDHGTGGHWCAKIIFFSLLAVLVTLIGLIILENRGLSELEANSVESRYSNILEGWLEDAPDDDHHDEHTLELNHHDDDEEDDHYESNDTGDHEDDDEHADDDENDHADDDDEDENANEDESADDEEDENADNEEDEDGHEDDDEQDSQQLDEADNEDEDDRSPYKYYAHEDEDDNEDENKNDDEEEDEEKTAEDEDEDEQNNENESDEGFEDGDEEDNRNVEDDDDEETNDNDDDEEENQTREDEDDHDEHDEEDDEVEVEKIEREASEEEPISVGLPVLSEEDDDEQDNKDNDDDEQEDDNDEADQEEEEAADDDFLEAEEPVVERVTAPAGKPFIEVDENDVSTETPPDTLEEEEEYEKQQEELRKEEEQSTHHIWLKLTVGAALLVATHAVLRRATAPRDEAEVERVEREETPAVDRRMTLIPEETSRPVVTKKEIEKPVVEEIVRREAPVVKAPVIQQESEEEEEPEIEEIVEEEIEEDEPEKLEVPQKEDDKELYSDEEEEEAVVPKKEALKAAEPPKPEPEDEDPDDVEIIDDEQLEEEEMEEEEVSDVDDAELLSRLEAKYGRLPEPERPGPRHKDGGNSVGDAWPGEPADAYWRQQLDSAERDLRQGAWSAALSAAEAGALGGSGRARWIAAAALDRLAEARRDNALLSRAIAAYFRLLEMSDRLSDKKLLEVARRTLDRIQFRGNYLKAEPVYRLLIRRFPNEPAYRNNMTISFLMANRNDLAENVLRETLARWPDDRVALAHYGFILKTSHKDKLEESVELFRKALAGDAGPACEPRFYYHYGDALLLLGRHKEAHEVHKRGARLGHFLSPAQRSLYNVPRLKSRPWWDVNETPYAALARNLERNWKEILKEGQKAAALYKEEEEGLRERGEWSQLDLFVRGLEVSGRCAACPATCGAVRGAGGGGCRRGQVKFSLMAPGTHVRPHVGPTNCRLRMHLGLSNTSNTFLRVDQETRQWQEGKVLMFDDSFEHEVWHNGSAPRLVLIVDVWHPELTPHERRTLPPI